MESLIIMMVMYMQDRQNRKFFFLCPECLTLQKRWHEEFRCVEDATRVIDESGGTYIEDTSHDDYDFIDSYCDECGKEFSQISNTFMIAIDLRKLEIIPYGEYWIKNKKILEKNRNKIIDQFLRMTDSNDIINV